MKIQARIATTEVIGGNYCIRNRTKDLEIKGFEIILPHYYIFTAISPGPQNGVHYNQAQGYQEKIIDRKKGGC
ncbi:MAG: hypothetical protein JNK14_10930 [Chitinophagaceae bacterium]|nr:hypothetical protein [Chitinophagaceae bacterium]